MTKLVPAAIFAATLATNAHAKGQAGERLARFVTEECSYLSAHFGADVDSVLPHFGRVRRVERITENVSTPHPRFHFEPTGLPRWRAWIEDGIELHVKVPSKTAILVSDLESTLGPAELRESDLKLIEGATRFAIPDEFQFKRETCMIIVFGDGKSEDIHRQRVLEIMLID
jgi:hypothetical protein